MKLKNILKKIIMKPQINFAKYEEIKVQMEITLGTIQSVERVPKSNKMLKMSVFFTDQDQRTVLTNIGDRIDNIMDLVFGTYPFITNMEPIKIMGIESQAMIMVPEIDGKINLMGKSGSNLM